jgi:signal transduction histidine kinase/DNA-binding NarL/FixJ family response regulator
MGRLDGDSRDDKQFSKMAPQARTLRLLLIEDNPGDARLIRELLRELAYFPFSLVHVQTLAAAFEQLNQSEVDAVLLDLDLPDSHGLETLTRVRAFRASVAIVILSGNTDREVALGAVSEGAQEYLLKGHLDPEMLVRTVRFAVEHKRLSDHQQFLSDASRLLAQTLDYEHVLQQVVQVPVPLLGDVSVLMLDPTEGVVPRVLVHSSDPSLSERLQPMPPGVSETAFLEPDESSSMLESELVGRHGRFGTIRLLRGQSRQPFDQQDARVLQDLAGRASSAIENARLHRELELALRLRDDVLASTSHDLRSPLVGIGMQATVLARVLQRHPAGRSRADMLSQLLTGLEDIGATAQRALALIQEILDAAAVHAGQELQLARQPVDLVALVERIVSDHRARDTYHELLVIAPSGPLLGNWDPVRLGRVLDNLIGNALKYSPLRRPVEVEVQSETRDHVRWAVVCVRDHGVGIPAAELERVFERFFRASNVGSDARGAGLGLWGVRRIVEQHGGRVEAKSQEGAGSTFTISLPCDD